MPEPRHQCVFLQGKYKEKKCSENVTSVLKVSKFHNA